MARRRTTTLGLIARALIEKQWHATAVRAQIHAILGDDSDQFVAAAGRVLFVVLGALMAEDIDHDLPDVRIVRGACNALYEQAGVPVIDPTRRASLRSGLEACDRLVDGLQRKSLIDAACDLELKLKTGHLDWASFESLLEGIAA
ncbi:hypothetical protein ABL840_26830 [Variovorax sp. NFACC27]|uniref:hypothetical protein n=1 Tax=unclassified Variovorax TaxID=663243 RepID=UPI000899BCE5|nr:hypothetical protein SAMN03159371_03684 [Variovorax sp. NFACC28]SEG78035.1 hypothetical protein SAMN03159365_03763 [Variovorax sp. NFACC29]SFC96190.1 hypothetical protein SAMN03159379_03660 [Variovorax sp. NFACC26]SFG09259.1 hypothetical protein SAMN03159447_01768 [Variovorax sp. NFACC27]